MEPTIEKRRAIALARLDAVMELRKSVRNTINDIIPPRVGNDLHQGMRKGMIDAMDIIDSFIEEHYGRIKE